MSAGELRLYLTFDDGPDPVWTPRVLDALAGIGAGATFFVIAPKALRHAEIVERALDEGHGVELHCVDHVDHAHLSAAEGEREARTGVEMLRGRFGPEVARRWRPPFGSVAPWQAEVAARVGLEIHTWTIDSRDWSGLRAVQMMAVIGPKLIDRAVLLMHDGVGPGSGRDGAGETVRLLPLLAQVVDDFLRY